MNGKNYRGVLVAILVISLGLLFVSNINAITGHVTETSSSNVTIAKYFSIDQSQALQDGIEFGNINILPVDDQNASHNYDGGASASQYYFNVSTDSNTDVDFCISADALNTSASDEIPLVNESYFYGIVANGTEPDVSNEVSLTTIDADAGLNVGIGATNYYRFWLDVPVAQAVGTYNNTISFEISQGGTGC